MDFTLTQEEIKYKQKFVNWFEENFTESHAQPEYFMPDSWQERAVLYRDFQKKLYDAGYAGLMYPPEYGGRGPDPMKHTIVTEVLGPWHVTLGNLNVIAHGMACPTIFALGTEEMKKKFIPGILKGELMWCQGFSEPNAGSDLGNVSTRAAKDGNAYMINGQKTWTTSAHVADYCLVLARTDPNAAKHAGLSYFIVDMTLPGIEVRPVVQSTGEAEFNEVFFEDVRVPESMMVGKEGEGWKVVMTTLMFERVVGDVAWVSGILWQYEGAVELAKKIIKNGRPASKDPIIRQKLARIYNQLMVARYTGYRSVSKMAKGEIPGPEGSVVKLFWSEAGQQLNELALEILGPYHHLIKDSPWLVDKGRWPHQYLYSKCLTFAGGTTEIQKNIIAERLLGLPKDSFRMQHT